MSMDFLIEFYIELIIDLHEAVRNNKDRSHVHFTISPNPLNFKTSKTSNTAVTLEVFETNKKEMWSGRGCSTRDTNVSLNLLYMYPYALCCKSLFLWISSSTVDKVPPEQELRLIFVFPVPGKGLPHRGGRECSGMWLNKATSLLNSATSLLNSYASVNSNSSQKML